MTAEKPKTSIKTVIILSIILLFAGIFYFSIKTQNPALQGKMRDVPVFAMPALLENQGFVTTKDITTDAPVLVSIWASWCIPCRNEHKILKHISNKYGIKIIGINFKDSVQNGRDFIKEYGNLPLVECCAGQLNQVFMNIISNAIDALENQPAPRIITIRTEVMNGEGDDNSLSPIGAGKFAVIRISDNGPGMAEPVINRSFDPFFTTKPVGKGTGLGLSISHHIIVEKHGGILKCISEPGKGAEFWIQIPLL